MTAAWDRFWFSSASASQVALVRSAIGAVVVVWSVLLLPDLGTFFGTGGLVAGTRAAPVLAAALLAAGIALVVGYHARIAAALAFLSLASLHHVDPWALHAGDGLLRNLVFLVAVAPGRSVVRLVQLQVVVMYAAAVAWKVQGAAWRDGTAVSYPLRLPDVARFPLPEWLTGSLAGAHVLTWGTVAIEAAIVLLVWSRRARPWVLLFGVALHLGIDVTMRAGLFSWIVLTAYVAFVPAETAARLARRARGVRDRFVAAVAVRPVTVDGQ